MSLCGTISSPLTSQFMCGDTKGLKGVPDENCQWLQLFYFISFRCRSKRITIIMLIPIFIKALSLLVFFFEPCWVHYISRALGVSYTVTDPPEAVHASHKGKQEQKRESRAIMAYTLHEHYSMRALHTRLSFPANKGALKEKLGGNLPS